MIDVIILRLAGVTWKVFVFGGVCGWKEQCTQIKFKKNQNDK